MVNAFVHKVETVQRETVETAQQLLTALRDMNEKDTDLAATYVVELLGETLSDGSVAYSIRLREADQV